MLAKLAAMFLVMGVGWWLRRTEWLPANAAAIMSRLTVSIGFPCLTLDQMLRTLNREALQQSIPLLALGLAALVASAMVGWWMARKIEGGLERRRTAAFLIAIPNWIFLPLPLAQALAGDVGTRTVLLLNVPAQFMLWTAGLGLLRGSWHGGNGFSHLAKNTGLIATLAGILLALIFPASALWHTRSSPGGALLQAAGLLGGMTIPLSLIVTGAQLAETRLAHAAPGALAQVVAGRLVIAPLVCLLIIEYGGRMLGIDPQVRLVSCIVAAMPVAVSCGMFTERYGGDRDLGAQSILVSTLASLLSVPLLMALMGIIR